MEIANITFQSPCKHPTRAAFQEQWAPGGVSVLNCSSKPANLVPLLTSQHLPWLLCSFQLPQGDLEVLFSNTDDIIKVNSRLLQDLQETDSREEEQAQLIGKQKTRQLSALDSCGVVLSIWSLQNCVQSSRKMQLNGGLHLGSLKQQV